MKSEQIILDIFLAIGSVGMVLAFYLNYETSKMLMDIM